MLRTVLLGILIAICSGICVPQNTAVNTSAWSHMANITVPSTVRTGIVSCPLTLRVFALAQPDFADIRVTNRRGEEQPYVISAIRGSEKSILLTTRIYNRTYRAGRQSRVTIDFRTAVLKNRIEIDTSGRSFQRRVRIEASDTGRNWQTVRNDGVLFRVTDESGKIFNKNTVTFPENNQRYLRITVYNAPVEHGRVLLTRVRAWRQLTIPPKVAPVKPVQNGTSITQRNQISEVHLDFGTENLPLTGLSFNVIDPNFYRRVTIYGRNVEQRHHGHNQRTIGIPAPWKQIADDIIARTNGNSGVISVDFHEAKYRYLQAIIYNGDNPPLHITGVTGTRLLYTLEFPATGQGPYHIFLGNSTATAPSYDLHYYIDRLRREHVTHGTIGPIKANPAYQPTIPTPTSPPARSTAFFLWLAFAVIVMLVIVFAIRAVMVRRK